MVQEGFLERRIFMALLTYPPPPKTHTPTHQKLINKLQKGRCEKYSK